MTKEEFAKRLELREYRSELTAAEIEEAQVAGLVVVYGASDDLIEFSGKIDYEGDCYGGGTFRFSKDGDFYVADSEEEEEVLEKYGVKESALAKFRNSIEAVWCDQNDFSWTYHTDIPHTTFTIVEGDDQYCRGIVFSVTDLR